MSDLNLLMYGPELDGVPSGYVTESEWGSLRVLERGIISVMEKFKVQSLSAPLVGVFKSVLVYRGDDDKYKTLVNPYIDRMIGKEIDGPESCPCVPTLGNEYMVPRMECVIVRASMVDAPESIEHLKLSGREARIVQHEIDHLSGTFYFDRLCLRKKREILSLFNKQKSKQ